MTRITKTRIQELLELRARVDAEIEAERARLRRQKVIELRLPIDLDAHREQIVHGVCREYGITVEELRSGRKQKGDIPAARRAAAWIARDAGISPAGVATLLGCTTNAVGNLVLRVNRDPYLMAQVVVVRERISRPIQDGAA